MKHSYLSGTQKSQEPPGSMSISGKESLFEAVVLRYTVTAGTKMGSRSVLATCGASR